MGSVNHFRNNAGIRLDNPDQLAYGERRFAGEVDRLVGVMGARLPANTYMAVSNFSILDIISWHWAMLLERHGDDDIWDSFPHLTRLVDEADRHPAVDKGWHIILDLRDQKFDEEKTRRRAQLLFNQTGESVRAARMQAAAAG